QLHVRHVIFTAVSPTTHIYPLSLHDALPILLPSYRGKETDIVFVVVAVNALSTVAMVAYPPLCAWLGFDEQTTGVMLGATIHDVDRKSTRLNSSHVKISYAVFCLKKKKYE